LGGASNVVAEREMDFERLREAFPSYPSELDVAKAPVNWAMLAQQFWCAASVLEEEMRAVHDHLHSGVEIEMTEQILKRTTLSRPVLFCMAFAIELAAKAATVQATEGAGIAHDQNLPFGNHKVDELCQAITGLNLSEDERLCLRNATDIIVKGKYPTGKRPRDDEAAYMPPQFGAFMRIAQPIYDKLIGLATAAQQRIAADAPEAARR
jgi:hypothetical protein